MSSDLVIATRRSPLALWQAEYVQQRLQVAHPALKVRLLAISTEGDRRLSTSLARIGGKGLFVKELEQALLDGHAQLAVHSMKDVPAELPQGLALATILAREDPRDALIAEGGATLLQLPQRATVGTSSLRRRAQLLAHRPDLTVVENRGNVGTRVARVEQGDLHAAVLAVAGLSRLGLLGKVTEVLSSDVCLPAGGQGALGIEVRSADNATLRLLEPLQDVMTARCVSAEREVSRLLGAGCTMPLGAYAVIEGQQLRLRARLCDANGTRRLEAEILAADPLAAGAAVAEQLFAQGAAELLAELAEYTARDGD